MWGEFSREPLLILVVLRKYRWIPAQNSYFNGCLLYTSDAADERSSVDLGGRRIIKKKNTHMHTRYVVYNKHTEVNKTAQAIQIAITKKGNNQQ